MIFKFTSFSLLFVAFTLATLVPQEFLNVKTYHQIKNTISKYEFSFTSNGLNQDEILSISWPYKIHNSNKDEITITVLLNQLIVAQNVRASNALGGVSEYVFTSIQLSPTLDYTIWIFPTADPVDSGVYTKAIEVLKSFFISLDVHCKLFSGKSDHLREKLAVIHDLRSFVIG